MCKRGKCVDYCDLDNIEGNIKPGESWYGTNDCSVFHCSDDFSATVEYCFLSSTSNCSKLDQDVSLHYPGKHSSLRILNKMP